MIISFVILILGLLGSGFFSGSETALVKLLSTRKIQSSIPASIRKALQKPQTIFSVTLVGNNICNILVSSVATSIAVRVFATHGELYSLITVTIAVLIFGEVLPKSWALADPSSFARLVSIPFNISATVLKPVSVVTDKLSSTLINLSHRIIAPSPPPDWKEFELVTKEGELKLGSNRNALLEMVFDLSSKTAFDIMTPIGELHRIRLRKLTKEDVEKIAREEEVRFFLVENENSQIEHVMDITEAICFNTTEPIPGLSEPFYVPESTSVIRLFAEMRDSDVEFAIVVDEHGTITGGISRDEIAEMFVGIKPKKRGIRGKTIDGYIVDGTMNIDDLGELIGVEFPNGPYRTIAGFVEELIGDIPETGHVITWRGYKFTVMKKTARRIMRIRVEPDES